MSNRTTLTLDDDVAARLQREARRSGRPYRAVVNEALRRGLDASPGDPHWSLLGDVAASGQARGPRLMDAHPGAQALDCDPG